MKGFKLIKHNTSAHKVPQSVRFVALLEASKGLLVILAGFGALSLIHENLQTIAEQIVIHLHLNPANTYPTIFITFAAQITGLQLGLLSLFAFIYALVRCVEAYGLWFGERWAEWFALLSSIIYIPFEVFEGFLGHEWVSLIVMLLNALAIVFMLIALFGAKNNTPRLFDKRMKR